MNSFVARSDTWGSSLSNPPAAILARPIQDGDWQTTGNSQIAIGRESTANNNLQVRLNYPSGDEFIISGGSLADSLWKHIAFVYDAPSNFTALYVDGFPVAIEDGTLPAAAANGLSGDYNTSFVLGGAYHNPGDSGMSTYFFGGSMDEFRFWDRALSSAEITEGRNREQWPFQQGLVGLFRFIGDSTVSELRDDSGRGGPQAIIEGNPTFILSSTGLTEVQQCSGNGVCTIEGTCTCNEDFIGLECNFPVEDLTLDPTVSLVLWTVSGGLLVLGLFLIYRGFVFEEEVISGRRRARKAAQQYKLGDDDGDDAGPETQPLAHPTFQQMAAQYKTPDYTSGGLYKSADKSTGMYKSYQANSADFASDPKPKKVKREKPATAQLSTQQDHPGAEDIKAKVERPSTSDLDAYASNQVTTTEDGQVALALTKPTSSGKPKSGGDGESANLGAGLIMKKAEKGGGRKKSGSKHKRKGSKGSRNSRGGRKSLNSRGKKKDDDDTASVDEPLPM